MYIFLLFFLLSFFAAICYSLQLILKFNNNLIISYYKEKKNVRLERIELPTF